MSSLRESLVADLAGVQGDLSRAITEFKEGGDLLAAATKIEEAGTELIGAADRMGRISREALQRVLDGGSA